MVFTRSKKIFLSVLILLGSFKPGESINVILPHVAILTTDVMEVRDFEAANFIGLQNLLNSSMYSSDILLSTVDLP